MMIQRLNEALESNTKNDIAREKELREELDNKMDNYAVIISKKIESLSVPENNRVNISDYYTAFLNTFSSCLINSVVIDSDSFTLETGNLTTDVISKCLSFIPFVGEKLSEAAKTVGEFLNKVDIKRRARKFKNLFPSTAQQEQVVGKAFVNTIASEDYISNEIININPNREYLDFYEKLKEKYELFNDLVDDKLYGKKYVDETYKMGVEDANEIIGYITEDDTQVDYKTVGSEIERSWKGLFAKKLKLRIKPNDSKEKDKTSCSCACLIYSLYR
jgi:hypothetical protein